MKATSRESLSSFATATAHLAAFAAFSAAFSCGLRARASAPLPGLDLDELARDLERLGLGERCNRVALCLQTETGATLLLSRDAIVGDQRGHLVLLGTREPTFACPRTMTYRQSLFSF